MTPLAERLQSLIAAAGPISVAHYMTLCLHDRQQGYYASRPGLGRDFITAPEISQVFGELIGAWAAHQWSAMGGPAPAWLVEMGPGRGLMAADMLRTAARQKGFADAVRLALLESSRALRPIQAERLSPLTPVFLDSLDALPPGPALFVANEFLDCLPVRQFVRSGGIWRERLVGLAPDGSLAWGFGPPTSLPEGGSTGGAEAEGEVIEIAMGLEAIVATLALRIREQGGQVLFIDYGPPSRNPGDSLRAFSGGRQVDALAEPGTCDITADVDFGRLAALARAEGLGVHGPVAQGRFLLELGARERAAALAAAHPGRAADVSGGVSILVDPGGMGTRFQVIALGPPDGPAPPGFE